MKIQKISRGEAIDFAALELRKYILMMMPLSEPASICDDGDIKLGLMKDFGICTDNITDELIQDVIYISIENGKGIIAGSNPRSVLLSTYEYLRQNGCRWLFPGTDGEYIPVVDSLKDVKYQKTANKSFRGQCIEGAVTQDNVLAAIDFAPKIGLNSYMLECENPFFFYDHWYNHPNDDTRLKEPVSQTTTLQWKRQCETEIKKRGLLYHDVGHGFTMAPFGINVLNDINTIPDDCKEFIAMINGKRELFGGEAINTNFCMSNKNARSRIVEYIVDYCKNHSFVDYLHFWIADGKNNNCECSECVKKDTADWYIVLLNELDRRLNEENIDIRIVFIMYCDLIWPPKTERFVNPKRFTLLFAPITRLYTQTYGENPRKDAVVDYCRNNLKAPVGMDENLAYLDEWKKVFPGECFAFEYHFYSVTHWDPSNISLAKCAFDDVRGFDKHNINGVIEDQSQRNAFPTGFPIYAWASALLDGDAKLSNIKTDYFKHAFGENWQIALDYLETVSKLFDFNYMVSLRGKECTKDLDFAENMKKIPEITEKMKGICLDNVSAPYRCQSVSWKNLYYHCDYCKLYSEVMMLRAQGRRSEIEEKRNKLISYLKNIECEIHPYEDVFLFELMIGRLLNIDDDGRD